MIPAPAPDATDDARAQQRNRERLTSDDDWNAEELLERFVSWEDQSESHCRKFVERMNLCYELVGGSDWDKETREATEERGGVAPHFNRADPLIDAICGAEAGSRQEVTAKPREVGDSGFAESATNAIRWAAQEADMQDEESAAFRDCLIAGIGCTDFSFDMEDPDDDPLSGGTIRKTAHDPRDYIWDKRANQSNLVDRRYQRHRLRLSLEAAEERWPDYDFSLTATRDERPIKVVKAVEYYDDASAEIGDDEGVIVDDWQWFEKRPVWFLADPMTRQVVQLSENEWRKLDSTAREAGVELDAVRIMRRVYCRAYVCRGDILPDPDTGDLVEELKETWFTTSFITGKLDRKTGFFYGPVWALIDPSKWANKLYGVMVAILNAQAKGGKPIIEEQAVDDIEDFEASWADPTRVSVVKDGKIGEGAIQVQSASPYPAGYHNLMEVAIRAIKEVAGVGDELLGITGTNQANVLEQTRIRQAYGVLSIYFNNLRRYRKESGRQLLKWLRRLSPATLIRVDSETGPQFMPLALGPETMRYDLIIDESPQSPNQKDATFAALIQLQPILQGMGVPPTAMTAALKYLPLPQAVIAELTQAMSQPNPQAQQAQQMAQAGAQAEIAKMQADAQLSAAKAQAVGAEIPMKQAQMKQDAQQSGVDTAIKFEQLKQEKIDSQIEMLRLQTEQRKEDTDMRMSEDKLAVSALKAEADIIKALTQRAPSSVNGAP